MMKKTHFRNITLISFVIGFMLAVQYNTVQQPTERDTRDIWEIRQELASEQKRHSEMLSMISESSETVRKYEDEEFINPEQIIQETVEQLQRQAGVLPMTGPGLSLMIEPSREMLQFGYEIQPISPQLLIRLLNDLYRHHAQAVEIDGQRVTLHSAIRDINGRTTINSMPIDETNMEIKIITANYDDAEKLSSVLFASTYRDEFFIDNLQLTIQPAQQHTRIDSTVDLPRYDYLTEIKGD